MNFSDVGTVLRKELRETLRDRRTVAVMVLFPLVVYPLVSLLMAQVMTSKQTAEEGRVSRVSVVVAAAGVDVGDIAIVRSRLGAKPNHLDVTIAGQPVPVSIADLAAGRIDAVVEMAGAARGVGGRSIRIYYDETREASEQAHARVESLLSTVLPPGCARSFSIAAASIAPKNKIGGYVLSKILPLIVVVMTMLGAFYPAIDITAGERERGTLETLLTSPVQRFDLMTGKVLAVAVLAALTGTLNIVSMSLTVGEAARLAGGGAESLTIPWARAAATLLTVFPAAFLFGAVMVAIGAMARGFKEAQTLLTPVYLLCFTPSLIAAMADSPLTGMNLLFPGTNLTLLARDLMLARATIAHATVVIGSTVLYGALALSFAARLYDSERLLAATEGNGVGLGTWLRQLIAGAAGQATRRRAADGSSRNGDTTTGAPERPLSPTGAYVPTAGQAIALFGVAFVLWFFVFTWLQHWRLMPGLVVSQWVGFFGLVWLHARLEGRRLADVIGFRRPRVWALGGAVLLGISGWVILGVLADRLMPPPRQLIEEMRRLIRPPGGGRPLVISLLVLALTPAICEEALFRGPILRGLRAGFSVPAACLLTGLLFGIMHGDVWRFVPTSALGALLSWVALTSGSIVPSMLVHFINNGALIVLGYYGLDEAAEKLSPQVEIFLFASAIVLFVAGIAAVRKGKSRTAGHAGQTS